MVNGIESYEFQDDCVDFLFDKTTASGTKQIITVKAPTGAGKTVILIKYVDMFLKNTSEKTAFVWFCPGKGNLEEQSKDKMDELCPHIDTRNLLYSMQVGFDAGSVTFINWELVTKKGNNSLKDGEKKNIYDRIEDARKDGIKFIVIIDEEHSNDSAKANTLVESFKYKHMIRVSATPKKVAHQEFYEIPEDEVINAGLITRGIYVNENVNEKDEVENDYDYLLELADLKRKEIQSGYEMYEKNIRPLVIVQFPVGQPETVEAVEKKLADMGYTYDNGMVNVWMSDDHRISDDLTELDGTPAFLLMKQAIATGWDCPRAKILVKLREGGSKDFQIQTIGRIRRMPERVHYGFPGVLDMCYIYTLDSDYKEAVLTSLDKAYQVRKLFLKDEYKAFSLTKEMRNLDIDQGIGERELLDMVHKHFVDKYHLTTVKAENENLLRKAEYKFFHEIDSKVLQGEFRHLSDLANVSSSRKVGIKTKINTHTHGIYLLHSVDEIKKITSAPNQKIRNILQRLFRKGKRNSKKLLSLDTNDFYAFIINNIPTIKQEFREIMAQTGGTQLAFLGEAKTTTFNIPEMELYKYGTVEEVEQFDKNVYTGYTNEFLCSETGKSTPEQLFEKFCQYSDAVEWFYKNGDAGQQYLSIVYHKGGLKKQWLFYPDYIIKLKNGDVWIIEAKGGMQNGHSKNIDMQVKNKFEAFKNYAQTYNLNWGFVRDIDGDLFINNTEYTDVMLGDEWKPLKDVIC